MLLAPEIRGISNSDLPFSFNDGALWAGRGWNHLITIGARAKLGSDHADARACTSSIKRICHSHFIPYPLDVLPERTLHANPFHPDPAVHGLPHAVRDRTTGRRSTGDKAVSRVDAGPLAFGFSTENAWWGPGIRNGILMSNQAAGVPRSFPSHQRTDQDTAGGIRRPLDIGTPDRNLTFLTVSRQMTSERLTESPSRFRPLFDPGLTLGMARTVFARTLS